MDCPFFQADGGHSVHSGISFPIEAQECTACQGGICQCALACYQPEPEVQRLVGITRAGIRIWETVPRPARFLPSTREGWGRLIGAVLGGGGFVFFVGLEAWRAFFT
jgi:hypothetical protein